MGVERFSETVDDEVEAVSTGSRERALGVAAVTIVLSAAVAWALVDAGYGVVSSILVVWMFGNLLFLGLVTLTKFLAKTAGAKSGGAARRNTAPRDRSRPMSDEGARKADPA